MGTKPFISYIPIQCLGKTIMIATISPDANQTDESISTCSFAQRVALVTNSATVNEELEPQLVIQRLKAEIFKLREEVRFLKGENGDDGIITEDQKKELNLAIQNYITNNDPVAELNIGSITMTKLNEAFRLFKLAFLDSRDKSDNNVSTNKETSEILVDITSIDKVKEVRKMHHVLLGNNDKVGIFPQEGVKHVEKHDVQPKKASSLIRNNNSSDRNIQSLQQQFVRGVIRCYDIDVITDPAAAFLWFKDRYPGAAIVEENKSLLKEKVILHIHS
jgi:hypothetical protein